MTYTNINGKILPSEQAAIASDNRSFRYGYGLFETILYKDGALQLRELHFKRLFSGLEQLGMVLPKLYTHAWLEEQVARTVQRNGLEHCCRVRLQIYAGNGGLYENDSQAGVVIECYPINESILQLNENGLVAGIATGLHKSTDSLANLKTSNALIYAMAARQAADNKWNDALILNTTGHIIESTIANIFWVKDNTLHTPPLADGCIAGVMREYIITQLASHNIHAVAQSLDHDTLHHADEVFLTNAIRKIKWVGTIGNRQYKNSYIRHIWQLLFP